jgi:glycosyltransferase involved in cell wall biosynthesis
MKILTLVESSAGGTGRHVLDLAEGLVARGVEVHLLYSTRRIDRLFLDRLAQIKGLHHTPLDMRTAPHPSDFGVVRAARRYLKTHGPFDAVHGHSSKGGAIARLAAFGAGVPAFYTLHGLIMMDPGLPLWKWLFYFAIELVLSLRTSRIIAVSPEETRAAKRLGFGQSRVITIPNGIGEIRLTPRLQARQTLNVDEDALVIGFVGRLVEQKAPDVLLTAFAIAVKTAPNARLAMVGAGPLEDDLRELAWKLGVADKILWLGERDARTVLAGFDCFALSSRKEGLPYVVLEAMAAGLPVVATSSAGVEILVDPKENGIVVPPDDPQAFGQALTDLATNPALLASCARAARIRAARFTIDAMVDATLDAYRAAGATASTRPEVTDCGVARPAGQFTAAPTR